MSKKIVVVLFVFIGLLQSCNTTEPPLPPPPDETIKNTITLKVEWTDLYRVKLSWNRSRIDTPGYGMTYDLMRSSQPIGSFTLTGADTSYIDGQTDSLEQGTSYDYKIVGYSSTGKLRDTSKTVIAKTLTATSHDIIWQIDTLGEAGDVLYDVWGIDENNVWAVGAVTLPEGRSGVFKWNGQKWNPFPSFAGVKQGIFGFSENDIWVVTGGTIGKAAHWNGAEWQEYSFYPPSIDTVWGLNAVWGSAPDDVWAVGDNGTIIHWDGVEWEKIDNIDPRFNLWDVWGFYNDCIYAIGNQPNIQMAFYCYNGTQWNLIKTDASPGLRLSTTWGPFNDYVFVIDAHQYIYRLGNFETLTLPNRTSVINKVKGNGINNIVTVGAFSEVFHYNGISWKRINQLYTYPDITSLNSCFVTERKIFAVGYTNERALVVIGTNN